MNNPYASDSITIQPAESVWRALLQRLAAMFLFLVGWFAIGIMISAGFPRLFGEIPSGRIPESELTSLHSFLRFCVDYWFTACIVLSPPACFALWLVLRRMGIRRTRWWLLLIGLSMSPVLLLIAWLAFNPLLFR